MTGYRNLLPNRELKGLRLPHLPSTESTAVTRVNAPSIRKPFAGLLFTLFAFFVALVGSPHSLAAVATAGATDPDTVDQAVIFNGAEDRASVLTLQFDGQVDRTQVESELRDLFPLIDFEDDEQMVLANVPATPAVTIISIPFGPAYVEPDPEPSEVATDGGQGYARIHCNRYYPFSDAFGTYTIQRGCTESAAPWGYRFSSETRSTCVSQVKERGMKWTRNSVDQPMNSPHLVPCNYTFHGTYNPVIRRDLVTYNDSFSYRHNIGPGGNAVLDISGRLHFKGSGV